MGRRRAGGLVEGGAWWAVLTACWVLTASSVTPAEVVAGAVVALTVAPAAGIARRAVEARWRIRGRWLRRVATLPGALVRETAAVLSLPLRRGRDVTGELRWWPLRPEPDPDVAAARRALAATLLSATPGSMVIDERPARDDPRSGADALLVHRIAGPAGDERAGSR